MLIVVVGLHVNVNGLMLVQQRANTGGCPLLWEFPGGKLEEGETMRKALAREWKEELGVDATVGRLIAEAVVPFPRHGNVLLPLFEVFIQDQPRPVLGQPLRYVSFDEMRSLPGVPTMSEYADAVRNYLFGRGIYQ